MTQNQILQLLAILGITGIAFMQYASKVMGRRLALKEEGVFLAGNTKNMERPDRWYQLFSFLSSFILTRGFTSRLERQYAAQLPGDVKAIREHTAKLALSCYGIDFFIFVGMLLMKPSIYVIFSCTVVAVAMTDYIISNAAKRIHRKLLLEFKSFLEDVRFQFFVTDMVDTAISQCMNKLQPMMKLHAACFIKILQSPHMTIALQDYFDASPNIYLQRFIALCIPTQQYGDVVVDKRSCFTTNLDALSKDLANELLKQEELKSSFASLQVLSIAPILAIPALASYGPNLLDTLESYYKGSYGIMAMAVCVVVSLFCFFEIKREEEAFSFKMFDQSGILVLSSYPRIRKLLNGYLDKDYGGTMLIADQLKRVGSQLDVQAFTLKRVLSSVGGFLLIILVCFSMHMATKHQQRTDFISVSSSMNNQSEEETYGMTLLTYHYTQEYCKINGVNLYNQYGAKNYGKDFKKATLYDENVTTWLSQSFVDLVTNEDTALTLEEAYQVAQDFYRTNTNTELSFAWLKDKKYKEAIASDNEEEKAALLALEGIRAKVGTAGYLKDAKACKLMGDSIVTRMDTYQHAYFHWYELAIAILAAAIVFQQIYSRLKKEEAMLQMAMEDEVINYQSIVMSLMHFERMTVRSILTWMQRFSSIFRSSLTACVNDLPLGEKKALTKVKEVERFELFQRLIENLERCDDVGISQAFSNVEAVQTNYRNARAQMNKEQVSLKSTKAKMLAFIPMYLVITAFLLGPFGMEAVKQMTFYMSEMSTMV